MARKKKGKADGKRVWDDDTQAYYDKKTPRWSVKWWIGKQHVGTRDEEIVVKLSELIGQASNRFEFTPAIVEETIRYALCIHKRNQGVFYAVSSGRFRED